MKAHNTRKKRKVRKKRRHIKSKGKKARKARGHVRHVGLEDTQGTKTREARNLVHSLTCITLTCYIAQNLLYLKFDKLF